MNSALLDFFIIFSLSIPVCLILDRVWVRTISSDFYQKYSGYVRGEKSGVTIFIAYSFLLLGLTFFATYPTVIRGTLASGLILGSLYGFFFFSTYNLLNASTMKRWSFLMVLVDTIWGIALSAVTVVSTFVVYSRFFG